MTTLSSALISFGIWIYSFADRAPSRAVSWPQKVRTLAFLAACAFARSAGFP